MRDKSVSPQRLQAIRQQLQDRCYLAEAVQSLAQELSLEIMENTYGIHFR